MHDLSPSKWRHCLGCRVQGCTKRRQLTKHCRYDGSELAFSRCITSSVTVTRRTQAAEWFHCVLCGDDKWITATAMESAQTTWTRTRPRACSSLCRTHCCGFAARNCTRRLRAKRSGEFRLGEWPELAIASAISSLSAAGFCCVGNYARQAA